MNEKLVIETNRLTRYFDSKPAVYELNLKVPKGSVFAFLGRNGSGKTTTIRMLLGLLPPTRGTGTILGYDIWALPPEARARIGYLTEEHRLYSWMTVEQCCRFQAPFYPRWSDQVFQAVADHFNLKPKARVKELSRGERAGLCLALTLAPDPELLVLDDPALGLDPVAHRLLVESIIYLTRKAERTIFFSSHQLADVERVADDIAVLDHSVLRASCSIDTFRASVQRVHARFPTVVPPLPNIPGLLQAVRSGPDLRLLCVHYNGATEKALKALSATDIRVQPVPLEEALIGYLGEKGEKSMLLPLEPQTAETLTH